MASWIIKLMLLGLFYWVQVVLHMKKGEPVPPYTDLISGTMLQVMIFTLYTTLSFLYYTIAHHRFGTTVGKKPFRIYVVTASNLGPLSLPQAIFRTFGAYLSGIPLGLGYFMVGFHPQKRALHDLIAGTVSIVRAPVRS